MSSDADDTPADPGDRAGRRGPRHPRGGLGGGGQRARDHRLVRPGQGRRPRGRDGRARLRSRLRDRDGPDHRLGPAPPVRGRGGRRGPAHLRRRVAGRGPRRRHLRGPADPTAASAAAPSGTPSTTPTEAGWRLFLYNLRLYLTHFPGQPCASVLVNGKAAGPVARAFGELAGALGLPAGAREGRPGGGDRPRRAGAGRGGRAGQPGMLTLLLEKPAPGVAFVVAEPAADGRPTPASTPTCSATGPPRRRPGRSRPGGPGCGATSRCPSSPPGERAGPVSGRAGPPGRSRRAARGGWRPAGRCRPAARPWGRRR